MESNKHINENESLDKNAVNKAIKAYLTTSEFNAKVEKIVKDRLKNDKEIEDKVVEITKNVLTQLYKALWVKRGLWRNSLSNKSS